MFSGRFGYVIAELALEVHVHRQLLERDPPEANISKFQGTRRWSFEAPDVWEFRVIQIQKVRSPNLLCVLQFHFLPLTEKIKIGDDRDGVIANHEVHECVGSPVRITEVYGIQKQPASNDKIAGESKKPCQRNMWEFAFQFNIRFRRLFFEVYNHIPRARGPVVYVRMKYQSCQAERQS